MAADVASADHKPGQAGSYPEYHCRPMVFLLSGFISGILAGRFFPGATAAAWLIVILAAGRLLQLLWREKPAAISPIVLFIALGYLVISPMVIPSFPPESVQPYIDGKAFRISGKVDTPPISESFRTKCLIRDLHILHDDHQKTSATLPGRLRAIFYSPVPRLLPGDRVTFTGKIRSLKNFNNPGGFDYKQFMAYQQVWGGIYVTGKAVDIEPNPPGSLNGTIFEIRQAIDNAIASVSRMERRAVLSALIIGKTELISRELREAFSRAGASHLLAISGLHVGIVATCSLFMFKLLLSRSSFLLRRAWVLKGAALLSFLPVIGYGLISGMSPSTQRAVIMICVFLFAFLFDRDYDPANTLATAATAILIVSPQSLFSISFQLSFAAVTAILYGFYLMPGLRKKGGGNAVIRFRNTILLFLMVSAFAITGTAPLVMHYFNQFSLLGIVSNLVLIPLIGFTVVPLGLLATILYPVAEPLALLGYALADSLVSVSLVVIRQLASLPFGAFRTVTPSILELCCLYVLLFSLPVLWRLKSRRVEIYGNESLRPGALVQRSTRKNLSHAASIITGFAVLAGAILIGDTGYWIYRRYLNPEFSITIIDVGQGNAALLELPKGKTLLIDGGGFSNNSIFDIGAMVLAPYLRHQKIRTINTLIVSHPDADHLNGLIHVLKHFKVERVISTHLAADTAEYGKFKQIIHQKGIPHPPWKEVDRHQEINGVEFDILYPPPETSESTGNRNDSSIVIKASYKGESILFPGDIEAITEREVVALAGKNLAASLLLAPHHGSRTSSTPAFVNAVNPESVIISVRKNRYGLPSTSVINRYLHLGCNIFQTDSHGAIRICINDAGLRYDPLIPDRRSMTGEPRVDNCS